jgi:hypothetical protein
MNLETPKGWRKGQTIFKGIIYNITPNEERTFKYDNRKHL